MVLSARKAFRWNSSASSVGNFPEKFLLAVVLLGLCMHSTLSDDMGFVASGMARQGNVAGLSLSWVLVPETTSTIEATITGMFSCSFSVWSPVKVGQVVTLQGLSSPTLHWGDGNQDLVMLTAKWVDEASCLWYGEGRLIHKYAEPQGLQDPITYKMSISGCCRVSDFTSSSSDANSSAPRGYNVFSTVQLFSPRAPKRIYGSPIPVAPFIVSLQRGHRQFLPFISSRNGKSPAFGMRYRFVSVPVPGEDMQPESVMGTPNASVVSLSPEEGVLHVSSNAPEGSHTHSLVCASLVSHPSIEACVDMVIHIYSSSDAHAQFNYEASSWSLPSVTPALFNSSIQFNSLWTPRTSGNASAVRSYLISDPMASNSPGVSIQQVSTAQAQASSIWMSSDWQLGLQKTAPSTSFLCHVQATHNSSIQSQTISVSRTTVWTHACFAYFAEQDPTPRWSDVQGLRVRGDRPGFTEGLFVVPGQTIALQLQLIDENPRDHLLVAFDGAPVNSTLTYFSNEQGGRPLGTVRDNSSHIVAKSYDDPGWRRQLVAHFRFDWEVPASAQGIVGTVCFRAKDLQQQNSSLCVPYRVARCIYDVDEQRTMALATSGGSLTFGTLYDSLLHSSDGLGIQSERRLLELNTGLRSKTVPLTVELAGQIPKYIYTGHLLQVKPSDSIASIASRFNIPIVSLVEYNPILKPLLDQQALHDSEKLRMAISEWDGADPAVGDFFLQPGGETALELQRVKGSICLP